MFEQFHPSKVIPLEDVRKNLLTDYGLEVNLAKVLIHDIWYVAGSTRIPGRVMSCSHLLMVGNNPTEDIINRMLEVLNQDSKWLLLKYTKNGSTESTAKT